MKHTRKNTAFILILTLWIMMILSMLALSLTREVRLNVSLADFQRLDFQGAMIARAGIAKAICDLKNDELVNQSDVEKAFDSYDDIWALTEDKTDIEVAGGKFTVTITDEESKLNLNTIHPDVLAALIETQGYEPEDAQLIAHSIVDWRDPDDKAEIEGYVVNENLFYTLYLQSGDMISALDSIDPSEPIEDRSGLVTIKNDSFYSVDELLDVPGFPAELFYGTENSLKADFISRKEQSLSLFETKNVGLEDLVTVSSSGELNVNTAPYECLYAILKASQPPVQDDSIFLAIGKVIEKRGSIEERRSDENKPFTIAVEMQRLPEVYRFNFQEILRVQPLTTRSLHFLISSTGYIKDVSKTIQLVVERSFEEFALQEDKEAYFPFFGINVVEVPGANRIKVPLVRIKEWQEY